MTLLRVNVMRCRKAGEYEAAVRAQRHADLIESDWIPNAHVEVSELEKGHE